MYGQTLFIRVCDHDRLSLIYICVIYYLVTS